jgi:hypothetical protein
MNPVHECKGLLLASAAPRYTSMHVPLWLHRPQHPGPKPLGSMTTYPSLPSMPDKERGMIRCAVLPWPRAQSCAAYHEPDNGSGGRVATVSLRRGLPCQWIYHFTTECLLTSARSIAHLFGGCKASKEQCFLPARERGASASKYGDFSHKLSNLSVSFSAAASLLSRR